MKTFLCTIIYKNKVVIEKRMSHFNSNIHPQLYKLTKQQINIPNRLIKICIPGLVWWPMPIIQHLGG